MNILFFNLSGLRFHVLTSEVEPLGGSESSLCYLAREMARLGHRVTLMAHLPDHTPQELDGVIHLPPVTAQDKTFFAVQKFDAIVICNRVLAAPFLKEASPASLIVLWTHVTPNHEFMRGFGDPVVRDALDGVVYLSAWQRAETERVFKIVKPACVIGNGLTPAFVDMFAAPEEIVAAKRAEAVYSTTPFRGLPVLLQAMQGLECDMPLTIFSSMRVYQVDASRDPYADLYKQAALIPKVQMHGAVAQPELARYMRGVAFFTYPSIYAETFCNAALEAMAAGLKVLATDLGALPETTQGYGELIALKERADDLAADFRVLIARNVAVFKADPQVWAEQRMAQVAEVNREARWTVRAQLWERLLATGAF